MRDKRAIIIKSPRLQKIRNNLRDILLKAVSVKWNESYDKGRSLLLDADGKPRPVRVMAPDEEKRFRKLQKQQNELRDLADRSICKCVACGKGHRDMVYNKAYDAWYCTECYGLERVTAQRRAKTSARNSDKAKSCEEKAIESHSKTFL